MAERADLLQGTLDLLILKSLQLEPLHGWGISKRIRQLSRDVLQINQGSLYPALYRLEDQKLISATWGIGRDLFIPLTESDGHELPQLVLVRANARASDRQGALAAAARTAVPNLPYVDVRSFDDLADAQTRSWRLGQTLFGWFGFVGVCLSALGLYALLALAARQRTTEIGVRMALGARPVDIARLVLGRAAVLVGTGWLLGLSAALMSARSLESLLFEVQPTDASAFAGASIVVLLAGAAGCLLPAARAAAISPVRALRHE